MSPVGVRGCEGIDLRDGANMDAWATLGRHLRTAREEKGLSLRTLAPEGCTTPSSLSRYEKAETRVPLTVVRHIDAYLNQGGALVALHPDVAAPEVVRHYHQTDVSHEWEASWSGQVWVALVRDGLPGSSLSVRLDWGPWTTLHLETELFAALTTGKSRDTKAVSLRVRTSAPVDFTFGMGEPPTGAVATDIADRWTFR